jgi:hypothetical protein
MHSQDLLDPDQVEADYSTFGPSDSTIDRQESNRKKSKAAKIAWAILGLVTALILAGRRYIVVKDSSASLPNETTLALLYLMFTVVYELVYFVLRMLEGTEYLQVWDDEYLQRTVNTMKHNLKEFSQQHMSTLEASDVRDAGESKQARQMIKKLYGNKTLQWLLCVWKVFQETTFFARCRLFLKTVSVMPMILINIALILAASHRAGTDGTISKDAFVQEIHVEAWLLVVLDLLRLFRDFAVLFRDLWKLFSYLNQHVESQGKRSLVVVLSVISAGFLVATMVIAIYAKYVGDTISDNPNRGLYLNQTVGAFNLCVLALSIASAAFSMFMFYMVVAALSPSRFSFLSSCLYVMQEILPSFNLIRLLPVSFFSMVAIVNLFGYVGFFRFLFDTRLYYLGTNSSLASFCWGLLIFLAVLYVWNLFFLYFLMDGVYMYRKTFLPTFCGHVQAFILSTMVIVTLVVAVCFITRVSLTMAENPNHGMIVCNAATSPDFGTADDLYVGWPAVYDSAACQVQQTWFQFWTHCIQDVPSKYATLYPLPKSTYKANWIQELTAARNAAIQYANQNSGTPRPLRLSMCICQTQWTGCNNPTDTSLRQFYIPSGEIASQVLMFNITGVVMWVLAVLHLLSTVLFIVLERKTRDGGYFAVVTVAGGFLVGSFSNAVRLSALSLFVENISKFELLDTTGIGGMTVGSVPSFAFAIAMVLLMFLVLPCANQCCGKHPGCLAFLHFFMWFVYPIVSYALMIVDIGRLYTQTSFMDDSADQFLVGALNLSAVSLSSGFLLFVVYVILAACLRCCGRR